MNAVQVFENTQFGKVRIVVIDGEPWLVGKDVATALGYSNPRDALRVHVDDEVSLDVLNAEIQADKIDALIGLENESSSFVERKEALVRQIVRELPPPCNELLWGFFRDSFSMKTLAQMFNYSSENTVKVTKHRCQNKFRDRFNELKDQLF